MTTPMTKRERQQRERSIPTCASCRGKVSLAQQEKGSKLCAKCGELGWEIEPNIEATIKGLLND